jgi:hypothetical protein
MKSDYFDSHTTQNVNSKAVQKLFQIELHRVRKKSLFQGIFLGMLIFVFILSGLGFFLWSHQEKIAESALDYIVTGYLKELFANFPDAYVSYNQHKILPILDEFTNAAAAQRVSEAEFREIGRSLIRALKDKKLTYDELDELLAKMKRAAKRGDYFD